MAHGLHDVLPLGWPAPTDGGCVEFFERGDLKKVGRILVLGPWRGKLPLTDTHGVAVHHDGVGACGDDAPGMGGGHVLGTAVGLCPGLLRVERRNERFHGEAPLKDSSGRAIVRRQTFRGVDPCPHVPRGRPRRQAEKAAGRGAADGAGCGALDAGGKPLVTACIEKEAVAEVCGEVVECVHLVSCVSAAGRRDADGIPDRATGGNE